MDMRCPKCGSENTTKIPIELLGGIKDIWYMLLFVSLIGGTISPICWIFCFVCMIIIFITNLLRKIAYRNEWIMQCSRCGTEFTIVNPDKIDKINSKKIIEQGKINDKIKLRKECLLRNGMLNDDEVLKGEINYFGFHKNLFSNSNGKLKVTDKAIICYNEAGSLEFQKKKLLW